MNEAIAMGTHANGTVVRSALLRRSGERVEVMRLIEGAVSADTAGADIPRIACHGGLHVFSREWSFPPAPEENLRRMIGHRVEAELPVPGDELLWGLRPLGKSAGRTHGAAVFVQAARREHVERSFSELRQVVSPDVLTTLPEAFTAFCQYGLRPPLGEESAVVVLARSEEWLVAVLKQGVARCVRRIPSTGASAESLCVECRHLVDVEMPVNRVQRALWCAAAGAAAHQSQLEATLGIPVSALEASENLCSEAGAPVQAGELALWMPAIGLALANVFRDEGLIRLYVREQAQPLPKRDYLRTLKSRPMLVGALAAGLALLAVLVHIGALTWERRKMEALVASGGIAAPKVSDLEPKVRALQRIGMYRIDVERITAETCERLPDALTLSSFHVGRDQRVTLKGTAKDPKAVYAWTDELRKMPGWQNVIAERAEPKENGAFTISAQLTGVMKFTAASRANPWR